VPSIVFQLNALGAFSMLFFYTLVKLFNTIFVLLLFVNLLLSLVLFENIFFVHEVWFILEPKHATNLIFDVFIFDLIIKI
jgi:hypothetical protein